MNTRNGYCISYPRRWQRGDAFDGAGIYAAIGMRKFSLPSGALDVSAFPDASPTLKPISFNSDLKTHMDDLRKFARVEQMEVLEERKLLVSGSEALFLKTRYFDPRERSSWVEEIIFTRRNGLVYRLELQARADQLRRFEPVFTRFANSFQFDCRRHN